VGGWHVAANPTDTHLLIPACRADQRIILAGRNKRLSGFLVTMETMLPTQGHERRLNDRLPGGGGASGATEGGGHKGAVGGEGQLHR